MKNKSSFKGNFSKFKNSYIEARASGTNVDYNENPSDIFKLAKDKGLLSKYNEYSYFCNFRTKFNEEDCILTLFIIKLDKKNSDAAVSEIVINIIDMLERIFFPLYYKEYRKIKRNDNSTIGFLKVVTPIL